MKKLLALPLLLTSVTSMAAGYDETGIFTKEELYSACSKLIPTIVDNYDVLNLKQVLEGNLQVGVAYINCSYSAVTSKRNSASVTAVLNITTNNIDQVIIN